MYLWSCRGNSYLRRIEFAGVEWGPFNVQKQKRKKQGWEKEEKSVFTRKC